MVCVRRVDQQNEGFKNMGLGPSAESRVPNVKLFPPSQAWVCKWACLFAIADNNIKEQNSLPNKWQNIPLSERLWQNNTGVKM